MIKFFKKMFLGHTHEWEIIKELNLQSKGIYQGTEYHLQCKVCGDVKVYRNYP